MKKPEYHCKYLFTILIVLPVFLGCNKKEEIGLEVQPQQDKIIIGFDTNPGGIVAYSVREDSIRTDETLLNLLGSCFDPVFGTTVAGFYTQFRLPTSNVSFGDNPVADSIVLTLAYSGGYYGDLSTVQSVKVYEVLEDFYIDRDYYSNKRLACSNVPLAQKYFIPKPADSVISGNLHYPPHLRIKLDNSLAQKFIAASGSTHLTDNSHFLQFFKGLYVIAEPCYVNGAIVYFNLQNIQSKMVMYYHNTTDTISYTFYINEACARINTFDHLNYSGADITFQHHIAGDTSLGMTRLYLQAMAGVKTYINFPGLRDLTANGNIAVNKAELIITPDAAFSGQYPMAGQLSLAKINTDGTLSFLPDQSYGANYFGGTYNSATGEYRFNIATYVQNIIKDKSYAGRGLYLTISGASVKADRLVFHGYGAASGRLRLEITYTRLKN